MSQPESSQTTDVEGPVRWEHVAVTYTESITRTVNVTVRASSPLTPDMIEQNSEALVRLAQAEQHRTGDAFRKPSTTRFHHAISTGSEIAGAGS